MNLKLLPDNRGFFLVPIFSMMKGQLINMKTLELRALGDALTEKGVFGKSGSYVYLDYFQLDNERGQQMTITLNNLYGKWYLKLGEITFKPNEKQSFEEAMNALESRLRTISVADLYNSIELPLEMKNNPIVAKEHLEACKNSVKDLLYFIQKEKKELITEATQRAADYEYSLAKDPENPQINLYSIGEEANENKAEVAGEINFGTMNEFFNADWNHENDEVTVKCNSDAINEALRKNIAKLDAVKDKILDLCQDYYENREPDETLEEYYARDFYQSQGFER